MTGVVPVFPRVKFTDAAGSPLANGWVTVYEAGTTTKANSWQDRAQTTLNTNPLQLDPNGECLLWLDSSKTYKVLLQDSGLATVPGWPVDNIPGAASYDGLAGAQADAIAAVLAQQVTSIAAVQSAQTTAEAAVTVLVTQAETAKTNAQTAQTAAEAARDAALGNAKVFTTSAQGISATTTGQQFLVRTADLYTYDVYYNNAGVATLLGQVQLASGAQYSTNNGSKSALAITDTTGTRVLGYFSLTDGNWYTAGGGKLTGDPTWEESTAGTDSLLSLKSSDGIRSFVVDNGGRPYIRGLGPVLDSVASNDLVKAWEYEAFGDTSKSSYFRDKAKSALAAPIRTDRIACYYSEDANTSFARFPFILQQDATNGILFFAQRNIAQNNGEEMQRAVCRPFTLDTTTGTPTFGATRVIDQPATWAGGTGGYASAPVAVNGLTAGRVVCVYNRLEGDGLIAGASYERSIHCAISTDGGVTWPSHTKIMGSAQVYNVLNGRTDTVAGAVPARNGLATGAGSCMIRIPSGTYANRIVVSVYFDTLQPATMYSDDDGVTWTLGSVPTKTWGVAYSYQEPAITFAPDGNLYMLCRNDANNGTIVTGPGSGYFKSTNGGQTWSYIGHVLTAFGNCANGLTCASLSGATGFPKFIAGNSTSTGYYVGNAYELRLSYDYGATWVAKVPIYHALDNQRYSDIKRWAGTNLYIVASETFNGAGAINIQDSIRFTVANEAYLFQKSILL